MLCVRAAYHNKGVFDEAHIFQTIFFYMLCVEAAIHKKGNHKKVNHGYTCMTICLTPCVDLIY
jgi:hypothetical protein